MLAVSVTRSPKTHGVALEIAVHCSRWMSLRPCATAALKMDTYRRPVPRICSGVQENKSKLEVKGSKVPKAESPKTPRLTRYTRIDAISLIEGLLSLGMVKQAEGVFNEHRRLGIRFGLEVYNKLLFGWTEKGNCLRAKILYHTMHSDGLTPNLQSYAAMLELCERLSDWDAAEDVIKKIKSQGYKVEHILHETNLPKSQATRILRVLNHFNIGSEVPPPPPNRSYPRVVSSLYEGGSSNCVQTESEGGPHVLMQLIDAEAMKERLLKQFEIEKRGYEFVPSVAKVTKPEEGNVSRLQWNDLKEQWKLRLTKLLEEEISLFEKKSEKTNVRWFPKHFPTLAMLPPEVWAEIMIEEVLTTVIGQPDGLGIPYIALLFKSIGWNRYVVMQKCRSGVATKEVSMYHQYVDLLTSEKMQTTSSSQFWRDLSTQNADKGMNLDLMYWTSRNIYKVSGFIVSKLIKNSSLQIVSGGNVIPAFYHVYESRGSQRMAFLKAHPKLVNALKKSSKEVRTVFHMDSTKLPMLVPPKPWTSFYEGGYIMTPAPIARCSNDSFQHKLLQEHNESLVAVMDALNYVGSCPWRINKPILDLVVDLFNKGGDLKLEVPKLELSIPSPPKPAKGKTRTKEELKQHILQKKKSKEMYSLAMDLLYRLSIAQHYCDKIFWMPHNMDFRGRAYTVPPYLNHLTNDLGRSLLQFGVGRPLGKKGLDWLKIHIVNLHGSKKKVSLQERKEYANSLLPEIMDSADKPFEGRKWWQTADEPWQVLSCCREISNAIRSGDPEAYVSHLPVHQDGSCNGLQHYAALGRDPLGAKQVNLFSHERPKDTYSAVAAMVEEKRKIDAAKDHKEAKILEGVINRKVVKQTVMTVVYGVTWYGGRLQILKQIDGKIQEETAFSCSNYIVGLVFSSLKEMFSNARNIQDWLMTIARKAARAGHSIEWRTPLGLPVVQPYFKPRSHAVNSELEDLSTLDDSLPVESRPPDSRKQGSAMPPNFVHSLDATHMMLTALHCQRAGVTFVAVHDSFWTHACSVDAMGKICREQFVALHSEPILSDLAELCEEKYGNLKSSKKGKAELLRGTFRSTIPATGDFELENVLKSPYFFS